MVCNFCFSNSPFNKANIFLGLIEYELNSLLGASHLVDYISVHIRFALERYLLIIAYIIRFVTLYKVSVYGWHGFVTAVLVWWKQYEISVTWKFKSAIIAQEYESNFPRSIKPKKGTNVILRSKILQTETSSICDAVNSPFAVVFDDFITLFWVRTDQLISFPLCIPSRYSNAYSKVYLKVFLPSSDIPDKLQKRLMSLWNQEFLCEIPKRQWYIREIGRFMTIPFSLLSWFEEIIWINNCTTMEQGHFYRFFRTLHSRMELIPENCSIRLFWHSVMLFCQFCCFSS